MVGEDNAVTLMVRMENERGWTEIERFKNVSDFFLFVRFWDFFIIFLYWHCAGVFCNIETFIRKFSGITGGGINKFCK